VAQQPRSKLLIIVLLAVMALALAACLPTGSSTGGTTSSTTSSSPPVSSSPPSITATPYANSNAVGVQEITTITAQNVPGSSYINVYETDASGTPIDALIVSWSTPYNNTPVVYDGFAQNPNAAQDNAYTADLVNAYGQILASASFTMAWISSNSCGSGQSPGLVYFRLSGGSSTQLSAGQTVSMSVSYQGCLPGQAVSLDVYQTPGGSISATGTVPPETDNLVGGCPVTSTVQILCSVTFTPPSCSLTNTCAPGQTQSYVFEAYLMSNYQTEIDACSGQITVTWTNPNPAISLTASPSTLSAGATTTLTATITQPAASDWNTYICATSTPSGPQQVSALQGSVTSASGTWTEQAATTDTFVAYMTASLYNCADPAQTPDPGIYAQSSPVTVTWTAVQQCPSGDTGTYPNCVAQTVQQCPSGDTGTYPNCVAQTVQQCPSGDTGTYPNCVAQTGAAYSVTLSASTTSPTSNQSVTLTATANTNVGPTPYYLDIWDQTTGTMVNDVGTGTTDTGTVSEPSGSQTYIAYITSNPTSQYNPVATSNQVIVTWAPMLVTLSASTTSPAANQSVTLTATANTNVGPTPYYIDIWDQTTRTMVKAIRYGTTDIGTVSEPSGSQTYIAYITSDSTGPGNPVATSNQVTITWTTAVAHPVHNYPT